MSGFNVISVTPHGRRDITCPMYHVVIRRTPGADRKCREGSHSVSARTGTMSGTGAVDAARPLAQSPRLRRQSR